MGKIFLLLTVLIFLWEPKKAMGQNSPFLVNSVAVSQLLLDSVESSGGNNQASAFIASGKTIVQFPTSIQAGNDCLSLANASLSSGSSAKGMLLQGSGIEINISGIRIVTFLAADLKCSKANYKKPSENFNDFSISFNLAKSGITVPTSVGAVSGNLGYISSGNSINLFSMTSGELLAAEFSPCFQLGSKYLTESLPSHSYIEISGQIGLEITLHPGQASATNVFTYLQAPACRLVKF